VKKLLAILLVFISYQAVYAQFTSQGTNGFGNSSMNNSGFPDPKSPKTTNQNSKKTGRAALDDSTRLKYGPHSVYSFKEDEILNGLNAKNRPDTSLTLFQRYLYTEKSGFLLQDLGNQGTALRSIFWQSPATIGVQSGYNAYLPYAFQTKDINYYNTKSPFSDVEYYLGAGGQTTLRFSFARNVDSLWNIGFDLQRMVSDKNLSDAAYKTGDKTLTGQWGLVLHSNYQSKNKKYRILGHINYFDQGIKDQGGVKLGNLTALDILKYNDNAALLEDGVTESNDKFIKFHVYHEFQGFKGLQLFQMIDVENRKIQFKDMAFQSNLANGFYPKTYIQYIQAPDKDSLYNEIQWKEYAHKTGLKGIYRGFNYQAYFKQRYWSAFNAVENASKDRFEQYVGLKLKQSFGQKYDFEAQGEYLIGSDFFLNAKLETPLLSVQAKHTSASPSLVSTWTYNTAYRWDKKFENIVSDEIDGSFHFGNKSTYFNPGLTVQSITGIIYFDSKTNPIQTNELLGIFRPKIETGAKWNKWNVMANVYWNKQTGPDVFRAPELIFQGNLSVDLQYKKLLYTQLGLDLHYNSAYKAPAYQPVLQQYFIQNDLELPAFAQVDAYVNIRINRVRLFFKYANALQGLVGNNHYTAYLHPAMYRSFGYGVRWLLFD